MKCVISGSFRKFYREIRTLITTFEAQDIAVLSPPDSDIIDLGAEFVIFETDTSQDVHTLECQHLAAIARANFVYLYNPNGYVGTNSALELGYAVASGTPVIALELTGNPGLDCLISAVAEARDVARMREDVNTASLFDFSRACV